jgi:ligand-binding SRPBCC domain-containing protein
MNEKTDKKEVNKIWRNHNRKEGHFKSFKREHYFEEENDFTVMTDELCYETPSGIFGWWFNGFFFCKNFFMILS